MSDRMQLYRGGGQIDVQVMPGVVIKATVTKGEEPGTIDINLGGDVNSNGKFINGMFDGVKAKVEVNMPAVKFHELLVEAQERNLPIQIQDYIVRKLGYKPAVRIRQFDEKQTRRLPPSK